MTSLEKKMAKMTPAERKKAVEYVSSQMGMKKPSKTTKKKK